ncbi:MAG: YitT family protein [Clostridia bacterium]|nr:YitT family protein [Clostridia bacterium]
MQNLLRRFLLLLAGSAILAFGLYHIHALSGITEGGILGLTLLFHHHFGISPALSGLVLNGLCYLLGFLILGNGFILYSAISGIGFSVFYAIFESFPPISPRIADYPLTAAILGALFVGVGVGFCVRAGGAPSGDDALAMSLSTLWKGIKLQHIYLASDLTVLALSLTYIPLQNILYSLLTCLLSGQIIGWISTCRERKCHDEM